MRYIVIKYYSLVEDRQQDTKSRKYVKILALNIQVQELKILFGKKSSSQERNRSINGGNNGSNNGGNNSGNNGGSSWKQSLRNLENHG